MKRGSPEHVARAERWLAFEGRGSASSPNERAAAAARVYEKLHAELAPLLGPAGVKALLDRSARLVRDELASFSDVEILQSSASLREHLVRLDPEAILPTATALFGTFFTLLTTFIGDRLTLQVLRGAWPGIDEPAIGETKK